MQTSGARPSRRAILAVLVAGTAGLHLYTCPALGTIDEQHDRLPPPALCADPVEGFWSAQNYVPAHRQWYAFTLEIHRKEAGKPDLTGEIEVHFWTGTAESTTPPPCGPGGQDVFITSPGSGVLDGDRVRFEASTYRVDRVTCGPKKFHYRTERFSGTIDEALEEFQSLDDDGGYLVDEPFVFRRVGCLDSPPAVAPSPAPSSRPAPEPTPAPAPSRGCGCDLLTIGRRGASQGAGVEQGHILAEEATPRR